MSEPVKLRTDDWMKTALADETSFLARCAKPGCQNFYLLRHGYTPYCPAHRREK